MRRQTTGSRQSRLRIDFGITCAHRYPADARDLVVGMNGVSPHFLHSLFLERENSILQSDRRVSRKSGLPSNQAIAANVQRLKDELRIRKEEMLTFAGVYRPREVMFASGANQ